MKWMKKTTLAAVALSILALGAEQAAAQPPYTPTLSVSVNGSNVTIQWTTVNEAQGYNLVASYASGGADISVNLPASVNVVSVGAPNGVYYIRVRALAGPYAGPWSNEGVAVVPSGGGGCTPPAPPTATVQVNGPSVTIGWNTVGAAAYQVQYSRFSGGNELAFTLGGGTLSHNYYIPMLGTFYARVVAGNACGELATSNEVAFTITDLVGNGPRTPDPPPGQLLPMPAYGEAIAYQASIVYAADRAQACSNRTYLYKLVRELRRYDSRWGLNWKRGHFGSLSTDIVTYNPTATPEASAKQIYVVDVVSAICEANAHTWDWEGPTERTWDAGQDGNPLCANEWCAAWTLQPYLDAGYPLFPPPSDQR